MTQDEIIRMAREAGFEVSLNKSSEVWAFDLETFAALVAAHERERCIAAIRKAHDEDLCDAWDCIDVIKEMK